MDSETKAKAAQLRLARYGDRATFLKLWRRFMEEERMLGSLIQVTDHNLREYCQLFESYMLGPDFGLMVLAEDAGEPVGLVLFGEQRGHLALDTDLGRCGFLWGVYVEPSHRKLGLAHQMQDYGLREAIKMGFDSVSSAVLLDYPAGEANAFNWGAKPHSTFIIAHLGDTYVQRGTQ